jgi:hypothetical protein
MPPAVAAERFSARWFLENCTLDRETGCILYKGERDKRGPMRDLWVHENGRIPDKLFVLHLCDVPGCINLEHAELGTHTENVRQAVERGLIGRTIREQPYARFGRALRALREQHGLTPGALAKLCDWPGSGCITMYERGAFMPGPRNMEDMARVFGMTEEALRAL